MTAQHLLDQVAALFGLERADLTGRARQRYIVEARQAAAWLLRHTYPQISLEEIGRLLGGRDHTTIGYSIEKMTDRLKDDARLRAALHALIPASPLGPPRRRTFNPAMRWWAAQGRIDWKVSAA